MSFEIPKRILMGPGPSQVGERVLKALSKPTIGHLDPIFVDFMDEVKLLLQKAFLTKNSLTLPISAPGSAGMECCFVNLLERDDEVVVCVNGVFGGRMKDVASRCGAKVTVVSDDWGSAVDPNKVEEALKKTPKAKALAFVHAETSTGARSDARLLCELAHQYNCLSIVDAVTSLGGNELRVDEWGIDAIYSGTQKCLSAPPGLSPVSFSERAMKALQERKTPVQSWFLDLSLLTSYWGGGSKRSYHHTAPINALYGLHEALLILLEEGLEKSWARHASHHKNLRAGLEKLGLSYAVADEVCLPQLNAVNIPKGVDDAATRTRLLQDYNLEIGAGLGPMAGKIWRIGLMGDSCSEWHIQQCLAALEDVLR